MFVKHNKNQLRDYMTTGPHQSSPANRAKTVHVIRPYVLNRVSKSEFCLKQGRKISDICLKQDQGTRARAALPHPGIYRVPPRVQFILRSTDLFLERPGNLTGPKSYFQIKFSRKVACVLTSNKVHFVSLADNFTVQTF